MKIVIALSLLTLSTLALASGSWKVNCTSDEGINFNSDNGVSEIHFFGSKENTHATLTWFGDQKVLKDSYESSCNSDHAKSIFEETAIITKNGKTSKVVMVCREEVITSSSAIKDECESEIF